MVLATVQWGSRSVVAEELAKAPSFPGRESRLNLEMLIPVPQLLLWAAHVGVKAVDSGARQQGCTPGSALTVE